jgi:predicted nucleic acid-binding protein
LALISSEEQLDEFRRVTRCPRLEWFLSPAIAGSMVNEVRALAKLTGALPPVDVSPDPADNFLLAMAGVGKADYLVTGDGKHVLSIRAAWENTDRHGAVSRRSVRLRRKVGSHNGGAPQRFILYER